MKVYFIGIGGIGISTLAQYYLARGAEVFGSDLCASEITDFLAQKGAKIFIGPQKAKNLSQDIDLVIFSPAVQPNNPELKKALRLHVTGFRLQVESYPEALGELTKKYFTIAVSGSHGKSTTAAMISLILIKAGLNPTVILGTKLKEFGNTNFRLGGPPKAINYKPQTTNCLVIEADEYQASFLNYWPKIIVLTNIEEEHLDYYKNLKNILKAFRDFAGHLPGNGILIASQDDEGVRKLKSKIKNQKSKCQFKIQNYSLEQKEAELMKKILKIPGRHNVANALAALMAARAINIPDEISLAVLGQYSGSWRRFEISKPIINGKKFVFVSDYGHHPTEVKVTLLATREKWPKKKIWVVFQPHQYQRTFYLFDKFVKVFGEALVDKIIFTPIYDVAGREETEIKKKVNSLKLAKAIRAKDNQKQAKKEIVCVSSLQKAADFLKQHLTGKEIVIVMGAGDIYKLGTMFST